MSKKMLKRSLALGALMAFVITGSAMFDGVAEARTINKASGEYKKVTDNENTPYYDYITNKGECVLGGWGVISEAGSVKTLNSNIEVTGGKFYAVVGGNWTGDVHTVNVASTNIVIDGATVKQTVGGTVFSSGVNDSTDILAGRKTSLTILNGNFGGEKENTNCSEMFVAGGDLLKSSSGSNSPTHNTIITKIDNTNVKIVDGVFHAAVYGGSVVERNYSNAGNGEIESTVNEANVKITGGTFNDAIIAGGLAWGHKVKSIVNNANLTITGGTFNDNADIYSGGLLDWHKYNEDGTNYGTTEQPEKDGSLVKVANVNISDVTVNDIYGTDGYIKDVSLGGSYIQNDESKEPYGANRDWYYYQTNKDGDKGQAVNTTLKLTNVTADNVDIPLGSVTLRVEDTVEDTGNQIVIGNETDETKLTVGNNVTVSVEANGEVNDAYAGDYNKMVKERFLVNGYDLLKTDETINADAIENFTVEEGEVMGAATLDSDGTITTTANQGNTGIKDIVATGLISWRYEMNDMNKRMGELRNANGEHGVWVRMVRGETEYNSVKNQYNQYQLGYDEKLSVDPSWTVGVALNYTEADNNFSKGTGESTNKALSIYGSKLNDDGTFIDLIAKYARLENDFDLGTAKGDYDTNGYSFSAEYGKRIQQGNGLWIEPQVELTYGQVDGATYMVGGRTVNQDNMESLIGRVGFSLGKDISKGNVYARASYLYDFEGETSATFSKDAATDSFEQDLGGGWWEVGVGANINLSKATYIYADIEKTFGGEVDTNWQWNLGVRYSF